MLPRPFIKLSPFVVSVILMAAPAFSQQSAPNPDRILVKVDGEAIREKDLAQAAEDLGGGPEAQNQETLISYLIDLKIGAKAALEAKITDSPSFQQRLAHMRDKLLPTGKQSLQWLGGRGINRHAYSFG